MGEAGVLAAVCDPPLINRVGEGKGSTPPPPFITSLGLPTVKGDLPRYVSTTGAEPDAARDTQSLLLLATTSPATPVCLSLHRATPSRTARSAAGGESWNNAPII